MPIIAEHRCNFHIMNITSSLQEICNFKNNDLQKTCNNLRHQNLKILYRRNVAWTPDLPNEICEHLPCPKLLLTKRLPTSQANQKRNAHSSVLCSFSPCLRLESSVAAQDLSLTLVEKNKTKDLENNTGNNVAAQPSSSGGRVHSHTSSVARSRRSQRLFPTHSGGDHRCSQTLPNDIFNGGWSVGGGASGAMHAHRLHRHGGRVQCEPGNAFGKLMCSARETCGGWRGEMCHSK